MAFDKLNDFANQLLGSNAIKNLAPHEKEESVQAFINQNAEKLKVTFSSPEYFPNTDWNTIRAELYKIVGEKITAIIIPELENVIYNSLNLSWKGKYKDFMISDQQFKEQLFSLSSKLASRYNSRRHYGAVLNFIQHNVIQPFITAVYSNRRYIHNALSRFDEINYSSPEEAIGFIYTGLLLLPLFDISLPVKVIMPQYNGPANKTISFRETENNAIVRQNFIGKIKEIINKEFPSISPYFMDIISRTFYFIEDSDDVKYASKVLKIMYNFAIQWKQTKRERGAESFEASWLNVARINYKFYAYELGTLDELYKITIEEDL